MGQLRVIFLPEMERVICRDAEEVREHLQEKGLEDVPQRVEPQTAQGEHQHLMWQEVKRRKATQEDRLRRIQTDLRKVMERNAAKK